MASGIFGYEPLWGEWYIDERIGKGSYGEVYRIHKEVKGVRIEAAVKYISIPRAEDEKSYRPYTREELITLFNEYAEKFSVEISSMMKLRNSANVVRYEDHIMTPKKEDPGWDIIIRMELLTSLEDYLDEHDLSCRDIAKLGIDICSAIECCQANDIIHRDVKIENIFVDSSGNFKLGDFGVSKTGSGTATGTVIGTEDYMAPEISHEHKYNKTVDIYSLGIALYQLLNNRRKPFIDAGSVPGREAEEQAHIMRMKGAQMPPPRYATPELAYIVLKACSFNRDERYSSPVEMANDLKRIYDSLPGNAVLVARGRRGAVRLDNVTPDVSDDRTMVDIAARKPKSGQNVRNSNNKNHNNNQTHKKTKVKTADKKKSKLLIFALTAVACVAIAVASVILILSGNGEVDAIMGLPEDTVQMVIGGTMELKPQVVPADAKVKLTYSSDNENIATVDEKGVVTAIAVGEVRITVKGDDCVNYVQLNIAAEKVYVTDIIGLAETAELTVGSTATVNARVQPDNATEQTVKYSSTNPAVAKIDAEGVIMALSPGETVIRASADGIEKEMMLTVVEVSGEVEEDEEPQNSQEPSKKKNQTPKKGTESESKKDSDAENKSQPQPKSTCPVCGSTEHTEHPKPTCPVCGSTEHTEHPKPTCPVCGSTAHTEHPKPTCPVCGSTAHTEHPKAACPECGSTQHTEHPKDRVPDIPLDF